VIRCRVVVTGRVQGVFFRQSCRRYAMSAGVGGWVRNNADGTVEAALEGEPGAVAQVVAWMRIGPPQADVTDVRVTEEPPAGERDFVVR
jgi:acylphosphatase